MAEEGDDDDVVIVESPNPSAVVAPVPSTPVAPLRTQPPLRDSSWSPPHPVDLLRHKHDSDSDSDIEIISHKLPLRESDTNRVSVKAEPIASTIPAAATVKNETPLPSLPRGARKASASKRVKHEDSDIENSPPTARKSKRVRRNNSFDMQSFLLDERKHRTEFEANLLHHVQEGNAEFRKGAENTQKFQTQFLGILRNVFPDKD